jgi:hypothetical protein
MKRMAKWMVLVIAAIVTMPMALLIAALRGFSMQAAHEMVRRLPWFPLCHRLDVELTTSKNYLLEVEDLEQDVRAT